MPENVYTRNLEGMIEFAKEGIVSKTLLDGDEGKWVLLCLAKGQSLSSHTASMPATLYVIRGKCRIAAGGVTDDCGRGHLVHMPAKLSHTVDALEDLALLLILFKS